MEELERPSLQEELKDFSLNESFPCVMAKAVFKSGLCKTLTVGKDRGRLDVLRSLYSFVKNYRQNPKRPSSFILFFEEEANSSFAQFERLFWTFLVSLRHADRELYRHDPRVDSDPRSEKFGFSLMEEAFFLIVLHPQSPRLARRFFCPAIVFNPHAQFELMRAGGKFENVRDLIRKNDLELQGQANSMLADYGQSSEIFQYTGRQYSEEEKESLMGDLYAAFTNRH